METGNEAIARAERAIERLRIEYEKYFNGAESIPPETFRQEVEHQIRKLGQRNLDSVEQFRVRNLEIRFNTYREMFQRRVRNLEEGRDVRQRIVHGAAESPHRPDPSEGIRLGGALEEDKVEALYQGLYQDSGRVDLESFRGFLAKNLDAIRQKTGCSEAEFRLVDEGGKPKLKVKPIAESRRSSG